MFDLKVQGVRFFTPEIFELSLERGTCSFACGQCAVLFHEQDDSRPYSISSHPEDTALRFLIRRISGGFLSNWLAERRPGDRVRVSAPFGGFRPAAGEGPSVFVATGVGIAPFLSVLRGSRGGRRDIVCLYGVRRPGDAVERRLLGERSALHLAVSREKEAPHFCGRVTGLIDALPLPPGATFYLCGYDAMVDEVFDRLLRFGVTADRIQTEVFFQTAV
jgi:ferredoxin-NADP reductase